MSQPFLYYFKPDEFIRADRYGHPVSWWDQMDSRLLVLLDVLRYQWSQYKGRDCEILISPHAKALGRMQGPDSESDHNIDKHGVVLAADVMFPDLAGPEDMRTLVVMATDLTFGSIGVYPDWEPFPGMHLGTRRREPGHPAKWGYVGRGADLKLVSINDAINDLEVLTA